MSTAPAPQPIEPDRLKTGSKFLILFASIWNWLAVWVTTTRGGALISPEVFGGWLVYVVVFVGIAYAISSRRKGRNWNSFARSYFWLSLIITSLVYSTASYEATRSAVPPTHDNSTTGEQLKPSAEAERLRLAAQQPAPSGSTTSYPADASKGSTDAEVKRVLAESLKEIMQLREESDSERKRISQTLKMIFTVEAVDSPRVGSQVIHAVQEQVALDKRMSIATADWMEHTRKKFENSQLPQGVKSQNWREFLDGLEDNKKVFDSRVRALSIEQSWAQATIDFYRFAGKNRSHITIDGNRILLDDEALLAEYNAKLTSAKNQWTQLQDSVQEQMRIQADIEKEYGDPVDMLHTLLNTK